MNQLFIQLYVDEDVDVLVADLIRARGFQALTTEEAGRKKKSDEEQLAFAASQQRALVTHNRTDFEARPMMNRADGITHADSPMFASTLPTTRMTIHWPALIA